MPKNLTKAQARQVQEIIDRARRDDGIPRTAQQSIPFQRMFPDGICRVSDKYYTKTIQYQDINYQLAQQEDKTAIFEEWCSFLNFFDSSIHFELSFMNMATDAEVFEKNIRIPYRNDNFNNVRSEYSQMLKMQLAQGNNGLTKTKYITFGIEAESMREAKPRLEHVQTNLMNNFKRLGVSARVLNAQQLLAKCKEAMKAVIKSMDRKEKTERAPLLYDLTSLQRDANRILGFTAQQTLDYTQALYEKKLVTYPRTDSRYLTDDMKPMLPPLISQVAEKFGVDASAAAVLPPPAMITVLFR